jgi:hypothetical protein
MYFTRYITPFDYINNWLPKPMHIIANARFKKYSPAANFKEITSLKLKYNAASS